MKHSFIFFILVINSFFTFSQSKNEWFPADLNIQPYTANFLEPKTGFSYLFDLDKVRIDIGTSRDILHIISERIIISFGADFFTFTRARSAANFKFPVETIDYLFGANFGYKLSYKEKEIGLRFRFSHISAHLEDGSFDDKTKSWINGREPFVYSKEFFELMIHFKTNGFRVYTGFTFNFHTIPDKIKKAVLQFGFDYYAYPLRTGFFIPFIAYDFKLNGTNDYSGNNILTAGIKFGNPESRGLSVLLTYFAGKSVHGELFDLNENYATIGFNLDL